MNQGIQTFILTRPRIDEIRKTKRMFHEAADAAITTIGRKTVLQAVGVMIAGLGGVFIGMTLLYAGIRVTTLVTDKLVSKKEEK
ncbi:hypothetical protein B2D07_12515 [Desulfococcus multivorans]|nr:hypothetical protein B2D07_12515 [Desulfococcus multivorans]